MHFEAREILKVLYDNYLSDMELYQASQEAVLRSRVLFQNIYRELNKESKNFYPGLIEEKSKTRDFATPIQWLTMAHVVNQSFQLKEHSLFLKAGFTPVNTDYANRAEMFKREFEMLLSQAVALGNGLSAERFLIREKLSLILRRWQKYRQKVLRELGLIKK